MMYASSSSTGTEGSTQETSGDDADPFSDRTPFSVKFHSINSILKIMNLASGVDRIL